MQFWRMPCFWTKPKILYCCLYPHVLAGCMMIPQFLLVKTQLQGGGPLKELVNPIHNSYVSPSQGSQDLPGLPGSPRAPRACQAAGEVAEERQPSGRLRWQAEGSNALTFRDKVIKWSNSAKFHQIPTLSGQTSPEFECFFFRPENNPRK